GATYTLTLNGASSVGGNLDLLYGNRENYVIVNKQGIVRMNAFLDYSYGQRYNLDQIQACLDTLLSPPLAVGDPEARAWALGCAPNPMRRLAAVELTVPRGGAEQASVTVHDLAGRQVASLWSGALSAGTTRLVWDGRDADGTIAPPGLYLVRA